MTETTVSLCYALPELAIIQFQGADAVAFVHAQVTNDLEHLPPERACPAAYCSAKGRTLATMVLWRAQTDTVLALVRRDLAEALVKRLRMFVLRSKVQISLPDLQVQGMTAPDSASTCWDVSQHPDATLIQAPGLLGGAARHWRIGTTALPAQTNASIWAAADIQAGLPWIGAPVQDMFIPQTLNLDLIGAINFRKGCYPGQEVVARSHYRGTLKRRMARVCSDVLDAPPVVTEGTDIWLAGDDADAPAARVINAVWDPTGRELHALLEVQLSDLTLDAYCLQDGTALHLQALPYALPELNPAPGTV
ncbi:CAF17-like 4Fe-4S cluster assembly/insertion protein YgfZ [Alcaligenes sp. SDU_A2]|uniref:CAF17-like 4Fe-4S cluster assembly/insertion protein YgfZ n=1 Tax=Alcaligenes sp. SDU_A2 TaxID=3136634 RepID=UPI00311DAD31